MQLHDKIIVRSPRFKFYEINAEKDIDLILKDSQFLEALYIASPALYEELERNNFSLSKVSQKERRSLTFSLLKYFYRSCTRATPFGLFSGITLTDVF